MENTTMDNAAVGAATMDAAVEKKPKTLCEKFKYRADGSYPEVKIHCKNFNYAKLLLEDYTGVGSELTAILQYIYGDRVLLECYPEVSCVLEEIAKVEMTHLHLLAKTINDLGVKPKYRTISCDCQKKYWKANNVSYETELCTLLKTNLEGEKAAIAQYESHIREIDNEDIRCLLKRIIKDEECHKKILCELLEIYEHECKCNSCKCCKDDHKKDDCKDDHKKDDCKDDHKKDDCKDDHKKDDCKDDHKKDDCKDDRYKDDCRNCCCKDNRRYYC